MSGSTLSVASVHFRRGYLVECGVHVRENMFRISRYLNMEIDTSFGSTAAILGCLLLLKMSREVKSGGETT